MVALLFWWIPICTRVTFPCLAICCNYPTKHRGRKHHRWPTIPSSPRICSPWVNVDTGQWYSTYSAWSTCSSHWPSCATNSSYPHSTSSRKSWKSARMLRAPLSWWVTDFHSDHSECWQLLELVSFAFCFVCRLPVDPLQVRNNHCSEANSALWLHAVCNRRACLVAKEMALTSGQCTAMLKVTP